MSAEPEVERAAESVLGARVVGVEKLTHGDINRVYKVSTAGSGAFVLKIFAFEGWPEPGKLPFVEAQLESNSVPRARLIHYTRGAEFFPHGFSLSEHVEGANCKQLIRDGRLRAFDYLEMAGAYLRRVHRIRPPRFGYLGDGRATDEDFAGWAVGTELKDRADELAGAPGLGADLYERLAPRVEKILRRFEGRLRPSLVHADATPKNAIMKAPADDASLVLIDWDEAMAAPWLQDYTNLSYWYSYLHHRGGLDVRDKREVRAAFFRGYGRPEFEDDELDALENALHLVQVVGVLAFYFKTENVEGFAHAREILARLLNTAHA